MVVKFYVQQSFSYARLCFEIKVNSSLSLPRQIKIDIHIDGDVEIETKTEIDTEIYYLVAGYKYGFIKPKLL